MAQAESTGGGLQLLLLYDCIYPQSLGGVEHRNRELAKALARRGHRITLAGFTTHRQQGEAGIEIVPIGTPGRLYSSSGRRRISEAARLAWGASRLDLAPFAVIETANIPYLHLFPLAMRCRLAGKPLLVTWHEFWGRYWRHYMGPIRWLPFALLEYLAAQLGTETVAVSQLTAERVTARRRRRVEVIPNGIPVADVRTAAASATTGPPLLYAGRLLKEKRVDLLLRAVSLLAPRFSGPLLTVVGHGPERGQLEQLVQDLDLGKRVVFTGRLASNRDVWKLMGGARLAVQPSSREGFGLFALEAMAAGLPVVYCHSPDSALPELVVHGRHGLGTPAAASELARALEHLLLDESARRRLAAHARRRADAFDWSSVATRLESVFVELSR